MKKQRGLKKIRGIGAAAFIGLASVFLSICLPTNVFSQNLILNGDFELGNVGFLSDYTYTADLWNQQTYFVGENPSDHHIYGADFGDHTTGEGLMMMVNGATIPDVIVWEQTVSVDPYTSYFFSGWTASWGQNPIGNNPTPAVLRFTVNDTPMGDDVILPIEDGEWIQFLFEWNSSSVSSATLRIVDINTAVIGNDFVLDDLFFVVPEPSALSFLFLIIILSASRTRLSRPSCRRAQVSCFGSSGYE